MLTYDDVEAFLVAGLVSLDYATALPLGGNANTKPMPTIDPGPVSLTKLQRITPGSMIFASVGSGAGLTLEQTYDEVFITIRTIGPQGRDYAAAEALAQDVDRLFLAVNANGTIGTTRVLYVTRTGGAPQLIDLDESERYHFQATYITPAATGL